LRERYCCLTWFALQFLLILSFSCRDMLRVVAEGPTILPLSFKNFSQKAQELISIAPAEQLSPSNPVRESVNTYVQLAGIESGYGYFAPNVPSGYTLVFELHYRDGRVEYELPSVRSAAAELRIAGLLDDIGRTPYDELREILLKTLAQSIWRKHPELQSVRAILGSLTLPSVREFEQGKKESYEFLCAYDFSLQNGSAKKNPH
jgi:hypothetical protein